MIVKRLGVFSAALALCGCSAGYIADNPRAAGSCNVSEYKKSIDWYIDSAEAYALKKQTYGLATDRIKGLGDVPGQNKAIITDLDETAIDNSEFYGDNITKCIDYTSWEGWGTWEKEGSPKALPGAVDFFRTADKLGYTIFYVSDRTEENRGKTVESLETLGFPQVEHGTTLKGPSKEERFKKINATYDVKMYLGDTLHDFYGLGGAGTHEEKRKRVERNQAKFGNEWFVFPNPMYGDW